MTISGHGLGYSIYKHQSFNNMLHFMSLSMFLKYFLPNSLLDMHTKMSVCCVSVSQLCLTLCVPMGCSPPGSSVHGFLQARILEWFAISSSRESSWPRDWTPVSRIAGGFFTILTTREVQRIIGSRKGKQKSHMMKGKWLNRSKANEFILIFPTMQAQKQTYNVINHISKLVLNNSLDM